MRGKDLVLEKAAQESVVSLIERDHAVGLVSFCSNHDLGTALPPPSVDGLRPNSPVTSGLAPSHPAPSRRPRAVGAGTTRLPWTGASSRQSARPQPAAFEGVQFVPVLTSFARRAGMPRQAFGGNRIPAKPSVVAPSHPHAASACVRLRPPRVLPSRMASLISELASHEVPGFGAPALPSALGLEALAQHWRLRGTTASPPPTGGGDPDLSRHGNPASESSAETWPSPPLQRHPRGSNRVGEEGRAYEELLGSLGQGVCATSGEAFLWS